MRIIIVSLSNDPFELPCDILTVKEAMTKYNVSSATLYRSKTRKISVGHYAFEMIIEKKFELTPPLFS